MLIYSVDIFFYARYDVVMGRLLHNKNHEYIDKNYELFDKLRSSTDEKEIADLKNELYKLNFPIIQLSAFKNLKFFKGDLEESIQNSEEAFAKVINVFNHEYVTQNGQQVGFANYFYSATKNLAICNLKMNKSVESESILNMAVQDDGEDEIIDLIPSDEDVFDEVNTNLIISAVRNALNVLKTNEKSVIYDRYVNDMKLVDIANNKNLTRQRVEQVLRKAELKFMRHLINDDNFKYYCEEYVPNKGIKEFKLSKTVTKVTDMSAVFEELYNAGVMEDVLENELKIDNNENNTNCM